MSTRPVLVVHGIANHDRVEFEERVTNLQNTIRSRLPDVQLIPVFWADLGGRSVDIYDCLPQIKNGQWTTRSEDFLSLSTDGSEVRADPILNNEQRAEIITGAASSLEIVRSEPTLTTTAITEAIGRTEHVRKINDPELLKVIGSIVSEAMMGESAPSEISTFEVRGEPAGVETRNFVKDGIEGVISGIGWVGNKINRVISGIDKLIGNLLEDRLGVLNQRLRASLMNGVAATLGDIVAYHSNKEKIQRRLWDAVNKNAPGFGTQGKPIGLIAHSLGGVVSFDAAVAPASGVPLYVDSFVSFGSQPAFFEIIDPRVAGATYSSGNPIRLPATIKRWFNLWDVVDLLAFTAGTVFRLNDGSQPEDIPVEDPLSAMLDAKLWLHSIYWKSTQLQDVLVRAFG